MQETCGNIKTILADMQGKGLSSTAKLVAILEACGMTDRAELESLLECKPSTLREAKAALKIQRQKSSADVTTARNPAPEIQRSAGNPAVAPEIQRQNSSDRQNSSVGTVHAIAHATKESPTEISSFKQTDSRSREVSSSAFNEASENLIQDAARWMNADRHHAVKWLTSTIAASSSEAVMAAYAQLLESQTKGKLIADPIRYIGKTAPTLKGKTAQASADVLPFKVTTAMWVKPREETAYAG